MITHDQLVFEALSYWRYRGADRPSLRTYLRYHEEQRHSAKEDEAALNLLVRRDSVYRVGEKFFLTPAGARQARGYALKPAWQPGDAWVLLALLYTAQHAPCILTDLISTTDYINHAIISHEELHGAVNRLRAGGLITVKKDSFSITNAARDLMAKVESQCGRFVMDHWDGLQRLLDCPCCGVRLLRVNWRYRITEEDMQTAVDAYLKRSAG